MITEIEGLSLLGIFGIAMIVLTWLRTRAEETAEGFLIAHRKIGIFRGSLSIAISWAWAPAIFVASLQAYTQGVAGAFWFIAPNVMCFLLFAVLATKLKDALPDGYTMPQYIGEKYKKTNSSHIVFIIGTLIYLCSALVANANAGGVLLSAVAGIDSKIAVISMGSIAMVYSLLSGLRASVFTDVLQMIMVLGLALILVPWVVIESGGVGAIYNGMSINSTSVFDTSILLSFAIPATITLMAGPIIDQMFVQRAFAVKREHIKKTFVYGGILFGLIPLTLSVLGFIAAGVVDAGQMNVENAEMVAPAVIAHFLPKYALYAFVLMAFAGLCSTLDSALCAISSIGGIDIYQKYFTKKSDDKSLLKASRIVMFVIGALSILVSLYEWKILWIFMLNGAIAATMFFPVVLSLYWKKMSGAAIPWAVGVSLVVGLPFSIYANIQDNALFVTMGSVGTILLSLILSVVLSLYGGRTKTGE